MHTLTCCLRLFLIVGCSSPVISLAEDAASLSPGPTDTASIWTGHVGDGFIKGIQELEVSVGMGFGQAILGSQKEHDWAIGSVEYGFMFSSPVGSGWHRGNWELLVQAFGGSQYRPDTAYVAGIAPVIRYNFATGTRWVPFVNAGTGLTATDIRNGDLSTTFEFNVQCGFGVRYFMQERLALTMQYRFMHLSNAGLDAPNLGVNSSNILLGVSWLF